MNPRYLIYCNAQGRTTAAQLKHDRTRWPGGVMCGYILFISFAYSTTRSCRNFARGAWVYPMNFTPADVIDYHNEAETKRAPNVESIRARSR